MLNKNKRTIVLTAVTRWSEPPRMRHYIAKHLSVYYNIVFCELDRKGLPSVVQVDDGITIYKPGLYLPGLRRISVLSSIFDSIQVYLICNFLKKSRINNPILLNFKFDFYAIMQQRCFWIKYMFINDDFINMNLDQSSTVRKRKMDSQTRSVLLADRVFVSSEPLARDVLGIGVPVHVILSGHDFQPQYNRKSLSSKQIRVCFMGFIHDKLEISWLKALAADQRVYISLIGPVESTQVKSELEKYDNVVFLGPILGKSLQEKMSEMDVFVMPYTSEPVNQKASVPAKLFQYLACGKPVVSTNLENLILLPEKFVYKANDKTQFVDAIFQAAREDNCEMQSKRIKFAMNHGWESRISEMIAIIDNDSQDKLIEKSLDEETNRLRKIKPK